MQGVYFRIFVREQARALGLTGFVRNLPDPSKIEIQAEGDRKNLEALLDRVRVGPPEAKVEKIEASWLPYQSAFPNFEIRY